MRLSDISGSTSVSIATSSDSGSTWSPYAGAPSVSANIYGGKIAISALGTTLLWSQMTGASGVQFSSNGAAFALSQGVPSGAIIAADKQNDTDRKSVV